MGTMAVRGDRIVPVNSSWVACAFEKKPGRRELALLVLLSPRGSLSFLTLPHLCSSPASVSFAVRKKGVVKSLNFSLVSC